MALKLNLGAGDTKIPGFTSVDLYDKAADIQADVCELPYNTGSVDEIVCYQVIEHVPYQKSVDMFQEWYRVLKPGATATVETPDIDVVCAKILTDGLTDSMLYNLVGEYYRPWDFNRYDDWENVAAAIHRNPWNFERLRELAGRAGFTTEKIDDMAQMVSKYEENMRCILRKPA